MMTYRFLRRFLPPRVSLAVTIVFLLFLLLLSIYYGFEPQAEFRYQNL
jgi:hypothetical protein